MAHATFRARSLIAAGGLVAALAPVVVSAQASTAKPSKPLPVPDVSSMMSIMPPSPDPRVGLKAGTYDVQSKTITSPAAEASWNLRMVSHTDPSAKSQGATHSDLAFYKNYALQ